MSEIKKGDVVQLKSGGPLMTVQATGDYSFGSGIVDGVHCVWFEKNEPKERIFDRVALQLYDE